jgi:hypothetical protein
MKREDFVALVVVAVSAVLLLSPILTHWDIINVAQALELCAAGTLISLTLLV